MEGIPVKISEKYKPPRKITLPANVQNKLNAELKDDKYDFEFERFVADRMAKLKEQRKNVTEDKINPNLPEIKKTDENVANVKFEENMTQSNILTPVPLKPLTQTSVSSHQVIGGINISDFENDTSSPFDSVELKTLNDMEELAHVLGGSVLTEKRPENGSTSQTWSSWGYASPPMPYPVQHTPVYNNESLQKPVPKVEKDNETTLILQSLQKHIEERKAASIKKSVESISSSGISIAAGTSTPAKVEGKIEKKKKKRILPNPLSSLDAQSQAVARRIAEMGFPIARAARAAEMFGPNEGKVIEYVLEVQSLEEAGYPGDRVEKAIVICRFVREDAIKFLENIGQLLRLGFDEEDVLYALVNSDMDRDKALDSLIS